MLRRFLFLSVGVLALVCVIGSPSQAQAGHRRGGAFFGYRSRFYSVPRSGFRGFDRGFGGSQYRNFGGGRTSGSSGQLDWVALG
jgi:hypothetical protein